jgi:uncharacterized membrane protein YheB (UPF0754 family)
MNEWLYLIPLVSTMLGWLINHLLVRAIFHPRKPRTILGLTIQGIFPRRKNKLAENIALFASEELFSFKEIENKIADPENFQKIMPQVEQHLDDFLKVKLPRAMPVISMFIGDKTIAQLKSVFVAELELLFPEIMKTYLGKLQQQTDLKKIIKAKILAAPDEKIEAIFISVLDKELKWVKFVGGITGFIIGIIQLAIVILVR